MRFTVPASARHSPEPEPARRWSLETSDSAKAATRTWEERWRELVLGTGGGAPAAIARGGLWGLSLLYGSVMRVYRAAYDLGLIRTVACECRVISVGNLTVGGTGKSTTVRWLARWLREHGVNVAVLSYGYRAESEAAVTVVSNGEEVVIPESVSGDEPRMLAESLPGVPVLIGKRRQLSAQEAVSRFGVEVCVLDDAFQVPAPAQGSGAGADRRALPVWRRLPAPARASPGGAPATASCGCRGHH